MSRCCRSRRGVARRARTHRLGSPPVAGWTVAVRSESAAALRARLRRNPRRLRATSPYRTQPGRPRPSSLRRRRGRPLFSALHPRASADRRLLRHECMRRPAKPRASVRVTGDAGSGLGVCNGPCRRRDPRLRPSRRQGSRPADLRPTTAREDANRGVQPVAGQPIAGVGCDGTVVTLVRGNCVAARSRVIGASRLAGALRLRLSSPQAEVDQAVAHCDFGDLEVKCEDSGRRDSNALVTKRRGMRRSAAKSLDALRSVVDGAGGSVGEVEVEAISVPE